MAIKRTSACLVSCLKLVFLEVWISILHAHLDLGTVCMVTVWPGLTWRSVKTGSLIAW